MTYTTGYDLTRTEPSFGEMYDDGLEEQCRDEAIAELWSDLADHRKHEAAISDHVGDESAALAELVLCIAESRRRIATARAERSEEQGRLCRELVARVEALFEGRIERKTERLLQDRSEPQHFDAHYGWL